MYELRALEVRLMREAGCLGEILGKRVSVLIGNGNPLFAEVRFSGSIGPARGQSIVG